MLEFDSKKQEFYFNRVLLDKLSFRNGSNEIDTLKISKKYLFTDQVKKSNFYIFKNFLDNDVSNKLKKYFSSEETYKSFIKSSNGSSRLFFYLNSPFYYPKFLQSLIMKCMIFKNMIYYHHDYYHSYCLKYNLNPSDFEKVAKNQILHSWQSIYWYKNNCKFEKHIDSYGELACFLILSERGRDYNKGGLEVVYDDGSTKDLDAEYQIGDLVFLDQSQVYHQVNKIEHNDDQIGRLQLYIPTIPPNYINKVLYFEDHSHNPYFTSNDISLGERIKNILKSYIVKEDVHYSRQNPRLNDHIL